MFPITRAYSREKEQAQELKRAEKICRLDNKTEDTGG